jgi:carbonic anhydrase
MNHLRNLLELNKKWAEQVTREDPTFFARLANQQKPQYLWIGCSDSRVPANQIVGMLPGEVFVHRNVANLVLHTDLNCLSVVQYAIDVLGINQIIVCGHYGCGGVQAAYQGQDVGLINNWLLHLRDIYLRNRELVDKHKIQEIALKRLCELNVIEQVRNVGRTTVLQGAWRRGQPVHIHGCVYGLSDGIIQNLDVSTTSSEEVDVAFERGLLAIAKRTE